MLIVRTLAIIEDRIQRLEVLRIRVEPGVDVFRLDRDDAATMAGRGDFRRRMSGSRG